MKKTDFTLIELLLVVIIKLTAPRIIAGAVTLGTLIVFVDYIFRMIWPLMQISENVMQIQRAFVSLKRILELTDLQSEEALFTGTELPSFEHEISFEHVWFAYKNEDWILKDVSFTIPNGQKIALVGASGSGKTTTVSLLCGFYPVNKGRILIDGVPLSEIEFRAWRRKIGLILQDIFLFPGSILENVRVYNDAVPEAKVREAINIVQLDEFIRNQNLGLDSELAERGQNVSQGEKQLLTIARAVLCDPPILILDEATSSVDTRLEHMLQDAMQNIMKGRTSFVIAHRLSTIRNADLILVMRDGNIVEQGTHEELLVKKGYYEQLYHAQFAEV